jgi:hypothetical protein
MKSLRLLHILGFALVLTLAVACREGAHGDDPSQAGQEPHPASTQGHAGHHHDPPHGGAPVVLGAEAYHVEFVLDADTGRLRAYVLDGHMERFIRIPAPALDVVLDLPGGPEPLTLAAVADAATGETVGDTSHFAGQSDRLRGQTSFAAALHNITVQGRTFGPVTFHYPHGNE